MGEALISLKLFIDLFQNDSLKYIQIRQIYSNIIFTFELKI